MRVNKIAIVGLGYVGLPLAIEFGKKYPTVGFDVNEQRILELQNGKDSTLEVTSEELKSVDGLKFCTNVEELSDCNIFIITVPTPIDDRKMPDLSALKISSSMIGSILKKSDLVIYESTVYPGATEEVCVPILEQESGLKFNTDFIVGYSPERINPGDKKHRLVNIIKVTSGSNVAATNIVDELYKSIIEAGTHKASSIKVAEAAKVIENTQRDLNIALINELAIIFGRLGINTSEVLEAAASKWNFLSFRPGLVGGHCISVDPYYLSHKAQSVGYLPDVILSGRRINDGMGKHIADSVIKLMIKKRIHVNLSNILVMGFTFKEDCPDIRNTKVVDVIYELQKYGANIDIYDTWANPEEVSTHYSFELVQELKKGYYDAVIIAVGHESFKQVGSQKVHELCNENHVIYDVKSIYDQSETDQQL